MYCCWRSIYQDGRVGVPSTSLTLPHVCPCPKTGPEFPRTFLVVFFCLQWVQLRWEVIKLFIWLILVELMTFLLFINYMEYWSEITMIKQNRNEKYVFHWNDLCTCTCYIILSKVIGHYWVENTLIILVIKNYILMRLYKYVELEYYCNGILNYFLWLFWDVTCIYLPYSACSGLMATILSTPADVIKSRVMNQPTENGK
jgi:hypothetical protein